MCPVTDCRVACCRKLCFKEETLCCELNAKPVYILGQSSHVQRLLLNSAPIPDVDIKYIGGADPEMVFLDAEYTEVEVGLSTLFAHYSYTICTLFVYCLSTLFAHYLYTVSVQYLHTMCISLYTICTLFVYCLCTLFAHYWYTICTLFVYCLCTPRLSLPPCLSQRVPVGHLSEDQIMELLAAGGIVKRTAEEAEADEDFEPWDDQERQEL